MPFVLDASIVHDWAFDEGDPTAALARERFRSDVGLVPGLWWYEVRNGLIIGERRGRATEEYSRSFLADLAQFPITLDAVPDEAAVMTLARRHRLTVYDESYLELALREGVPLATLDRPLANAARVERVALVGG